MDIDVDVIKVRQVSINVCTYAHDEEFRNTRHAAAAVVGGTDDLRGAAGGRRCDVVRTYAVETVVDSSNTALAWIIKKRTVVTGDMRLMREGRDENAPNFKSSNIK